MVVDLFHEDLAQQARDSWVALDVNTTGFLKDDGLGLQQIIDEYVLLNEGHTRRKPTRG